MSNSLAIAATTLTLRNLLQQEIPLRDGSLAGLQVTTLPPDMARRNVAEVNAQLNIFLYQTAVNAAWRNQDLPNQSRPGEFGRPPLALNLHYLMTAYGNESDDEGISHRVLGGAMSVLHDHPLLGRNEIRGVLANNDLADQFERLRVTPLTLPMDEMSKLWTALQTNYRVSAGYEVTVLLIDSLLASRAALPVLKRGKDDRGVDATTSRAPTLESLRYPRSQAAARLGDEVALVCPPFDLAKTILRFSTARLAGPLTLSPQAGNAPGEIKFTLPAPADPAAAAWIPGQYTVAAVAGVGDEVKLISNELAFGLAPTITLAPTISVTPGSPTLRDVALAIACVPKCRQGQRVLLLLGDRPVEPDPPPPPPPPPPPLPPPPAPDPTLPYEPTFTAKKVVPGNSYVVRVRVDGVDSIPVSYTGNPPLPAFDPSQQVTLP